MALTCKIGLNNVINIGDYVWCKYTATSGKVGAFSDIATKTDAEVVGQEIPINSTSTPNGYFKYILVGYDYIGRKKFIADRNIQNSITWDTLNNEGIASELSIELGFEKNVNTSIRLLTGGIFATDFENEWDKIIVESSLNGTITPGDNGIWNFKNISSWVSTIGSPSSNRITRGNATVSTTTSPTGIVTSTSISNIGFRPLLLVETLISDLFLIKQGIEYYSIKPEYYNPLNKKFNPLTLSGGSTPNKIDIDKLTFGDLNILLSMMTVGADIFRPIDILENNFEIKLYKEQ